MEEEYNKQVWVCHVLKEDWIWSRYLTNYLFINNNQWYNIYINYNLQCGGSLAQLQQGHKTWIWTFKGVLKKTKIF